MKYVFLSIALLGICSMVIAKQTQAAFTMPFGGKIITTAIPGVVCFPPNAGPVVTTQTIGGLVGAGIFAAGGNMSGGVRAGGIALSLYSAIPIYTTDPTKIPRPGGYILGLHQVIPSFQYCNAGGSFPFPVMQTTIYGVSR